MKATLPGIEEFDAKYEAFRVLYEKHLHRKLSHPDRTFSLLDEQLNSIGIFSLAAYSNSALMWSHYGQEHKGICLGFEVRDLTPSADPKRFLQVRYSDEIPRMDERGFINEIRFFTGDDGEVASEGRISLTDASVRVAISTNATCWSYEGEWRYIERNGDTLYPFVLFGWERYRPRCQPHDGFGREPLRYNRSSRPLRFWYSF
jgi:hypothetical protein